MRLLSLCIAFVFLLTNQPILLASTKKNTTKPSVASLSKEKRAALRKRAISRVHRASQGMNRMKSLVQELKEHKTLSRFFRKSTLLRTGPYKKLRAELERVLKANPQAGAKKVKIKELSLGFLIQSGSDQLKVAIDYANPGSDFFINAKAFTYVPESGIEANLIKMRNLLSSKNASLFDVLFDEAHAAIPIAVWIVGALIVGGGAGAYFYNRTCMNYAEVNQAFDGLVSDVATNEMSTNWMPEESLFDIGRDRELLEFQLDGEEYWEGMPFCIGHDEEGLKILEIADHVTGPMGVCRRIAERIINEQKNAEGLTAHDAQMPTEYFVGAPPNMRIRPTITNLINSQYQVDLTAVADASNYVNGGNLELFRREISENSESLRVYERTFPTRSCNSEELEIFNANEQRARPIRLESGEHLILVEPEAGECEVFARVPAGTSLSDYDFAEATMDIIPITDLPQEERDDITDPYLRNPAACVTRALERLVREANFEAERTGDFERARQEANGITPDET